MDDRSVMNLKSSDRLKQEVDKEQGLTLFKFQQTAITNYDGFGYYATSTKVSDMYTDMYDIKHDIQPEWVTHVCWYNKC